VAFNEKQKVAMKFGQEEQLFLFALRAKDYLIAIILANPTKAHPIY
jgi:hypothetical protein